MEDEVRARVLQDAVIVAGHPRSGTSLACQLVESSGVTFPSDFTGDKYNRAGYYELAASKTLSQKLLKEAMTVENTLAMNQIVQLLNNVPGPAGLKLVRIPAVFFYKHVARDLRAVFIFRNPADVTASLFRRGIAGFSPDWFTNNNALIAAYQNIEQSIIIGYETLIEGGSEVEAAFQRLGLEIDLSIVDGRQTTQQQSRVLVTREDERLYQRLKELEKECLY